MRRQRHAVIVGLLAGSLALDSARAGRHGRCARPMQSQPIVVVQWAAPSDDGWCDGGETMAVTAGPTWCTDVVDVVTVEHAGGPCNCCPSDCAATEAGTSGVGAGGPAVEWHPESGHPACCGGGEHDPGAIVATQTHQDFAGADVVGGAAVSEGGVTAPVEHVVVSGEEPTAEVSVAPAVPEKAAPPRDNAAAPQPEQDGAARSVLVTEAPAATPAAEAPQPQPVAEPGPNLQPVEPAADGKPPAEPQPAEQPQPPVPEPEPPVTKPQPAPPVPPAPPAPPPPPPAPAEPPKPREGNLFDEVDAEAPVDADTLDPST